MTEDEIFNAYLNQDSDSDTVLLANATLYTGSGGTAVGLLSLALMAGSDFTSTGNFGIRAGSVAQSVQTIASNSAQAQQILSLTEAEVAARADAFATQIVDEFSNLATNNPDLYGTLQMTPTEAEAFRAQWRSDFIAYRAGLQDLGDLINGTTTVEQDVMIGLAAAQGYVSLVGLLVPPAGLVTSIVNAGLSFATAIYASQTQSLSPEETAHLIGRAGLSIVTWGVSDILIDTVIPAIGGVIAELEASTDPFHWPTLGIKNLVDAIIITDAEAWQKKLDDFNAQMPSLVEGVQTAVDNIGNTLLASVGNSGNHLIEVEVNMFPDLSILGLRQLTFIISNGQVINPIIDYTQPATNGDLSDVRNYLTFTSPTPQNWGSTTEADLLRANGGSFILMNYPIGRLYGTPAETFSTVGDHDDFVTSLPIRNVVLNGGDDTLALRVGTWSETSYLSAFNYENGVTYSFDGGADHDVLDLSLLTTYADLRDAGLIGSLEYATFGASAIEMGKLILTPTQIFYRDYKDGSLQTFTLGTYSNFEELVVGKIISYDARNAGLTSGVKLTMLNGTDADLRAQIHGSEFGDTFVIDTSRYYDRAINEMVFEQEPVTVNAYGGNDYVAGEIVSGTVYNGGDGIDIFEILPSEYARRGDVYNENNYGFKFAFSLDLEAGLASVTTWRTEYFTYETFYHTETGIEVSDFEWAIGSNFDDTIKARTTGSLIRGRGGNDDLVGRAGNDQLYGGAGADSLEGNGGADLLVGGAGNDNLLGGAGRDVLRGGVGNDVLDGGAGDDYLNGGDGNDLITDLSGQNTFIGGLGNDTVIDGDASSLIELGGDGGDSVEAGAGNDTVTGVALGHLGDGDDVAQTGTNYWIVGAQNIDGGIGTDTLWLNVTLPPVRDAYANYVENIRFVQTVDYATGLVSAQYLYDGVDYAYGTGRHVMVNGTYTNFERYYFTAGHSELIQMVGDEAADHVHPSLAGDWIDAGAGEDTVLSGLGDDTLIAGYGNDQFDGGDGYDVLDYSGLASLGLHISFSTVDQATGITTIEVSDASGQLIWTDTATNIEVFIDENGGELDRTRTDDYLEDIQLYNHNDSLYGGYGNDTLYSLWGNDTLNGGEGDDLITQQGHLRGDALLLGGAGNDTITSVYGQSTLSGGAGDDHLVAHHGNKVLDGGAGNDTLEGGSGNDLMSGGSGQDSIDGGAGNDTITGDSGSDTINGGDGADVIDGGANADTLAGGSGNDTVSGGSGADLVQGNGNDDVLSGNLGADTLEGGNGNDTLIGGADDDFLSGGAGLDTYQFGTADGSDTISDFAFGERLIFTTHNIALSGAPVIGAPVVPAGGGAAQQTISFGDTTVTFDLPGDTVFVVEQVDTVFGATFTITGYEDAFYANNDTFAGWEGYPQVIDVLANDYFVPGRTVPLTASDPAYGTVTVGADGQITYVPDASFEALAQGEYGFDSFTYTATDGIETFTATVSLTIRGIQDAPIAVADTVTVDEDTAITIDVLANDIDPDASDSHTITELTQGGHGTVALVNNQLVYTPDANWNGTDTFAYTMTDGRDTSTTTVTVTVSPVADAPVVTSDTLTVRSNETQTPVTTNVLTNDVSLDGDVLTLVGVSDPTHGTVSFAADGTVIYTSTDLPGGASETLTYTVENSSGQQSTGTLVVTVNPQVAPVAVDDTLVVTAPQQGQPMVVDVLANDSDEDTPPVVTSITQGAQGAVVLNADGTLSYNWQGDRYGGTDSFTYTIVDATGLESTATVQVTIDERIDPTAVNDTITLTRPDTWGPRTIDVLSNDSDHYGQTLRIVSIDYSGAGELTLNADGTLTYDAVNSPSADLVESFTYTVENDLGLQSTATATLVYDINRAPDASQLLWPSNFVFSANEDTVRS
ncbi:MAG: hypothetical protein CME61_09090, partial [Halobacteriovoraceae bacterium]|nr:hypothetical protein [Halobacteriovoraceae bacterium]